MTDTLTQKQRSERMSRIRSKNTGPEMTVRRLVHGMGFRYRLHVANLPGKPDLVFPRLSKIIFVHGCFWHRHGSTGCKLARMPKSKLEFWESKLNANRLRDRQNHRLLREHGWEVLTLWECQLSNVRRLENRIESFLKS